MIYVSTGGHHQIAALEAAKIFMDAGISSIELSGGTPCSTQIKELKSLSKKINFQVHNYFPPPKNPFVFNLASGNIDIYSKSYNHVLNAMQLAVELDRPVYSFHAGFLMDPKVSELGKRIGESKLAPRYDALNLFVDRINNLSQKAKSLGVSLLIENNVLSHMNYEGFGCDPFLMTTAQECIYVMENTPSNVNLLVDVAHLKVSAQSLSFDPVKFLEMTDPWIFGYHLSDNDGTQDSNHPISDSSWFWNYIKKDLDYYALEIYGVTVDDLVIQRNLTALKLKMMGEC